MKKKWIPMILLIAIIAIFSVVFTACNILGGDSSSPNVTTKAENGIQVTVVNKNFTVKDNAIQVNLNSNVSFEKTDFEVKVTYNTGDSKVITDYTLDASEVNLTQAASYTIKFTYKKYESYVSVTVVDSFETLPALPQNLDNLQAEYTGETINAVSLIDAMMTGEKLSKLITDQKIRVVLATEGDPNTTYASTGTNGGNYQFELVSNAGYKWEGGVSSQIVNWQITPKQIPIPTVTEGALTTFEFDGTTKTLSVDAHGYNNVFVFEHKEGIDAGTYECQALIPDELQNNYIFRRENDLQLPYNNVVGTFTITPMILDYPVLVDNEGEALELGEDEFGNPAYHFNYTGETIAISTSFDALSDYFGKYITPTTLCNVGEYNVNFSFVDNVEYSNFRWRDSEETLNNYIPTLTVIVDPVDYEFPEEYNASVWQMTGTYSSGEYMFSNAFGLSYNLTDEAKADLVQKGIWTEEISYLTYADNMDLIYVSGQRNLTFQFHRDSNHNPVNVTVAVEIEKAKQEVNAYWSSAYQKINENTSRSLSLSEHLRYNGVNQINAHSVTVSGSVGGLVETYTHYYGTEEGVYGQEPVTELINAGYYKTIYTIASEDPNIMIVDGNGDEIQPMELEWVIDKAPIYLSAAISGTVKGTYSETENAYCGFYTGSAKTLEIGSPVIAIEYYGNTWFDVKSSDNLGDNITLGHYVNIETPITYTLYKWDTGNTAWAEVAEATDVGRYKWEVSATLTDYADVQGNYEILNVIDGEFLIVSNEIDATALTWLNEGTYSYGAGIPYVKNIPLGLDISYSGDSHNVGNHTITATFSVDNYMDGYEGVTVTYPTNWTADGTGSNNMANYIITQRIITVADFYLEIDGEELTAPREVEYAEHEAYEGAGFYYADSHFAYVRMRNAIEGVTVTDLSREFDPIGQIYAGVSKSEVGEYTCTAWITLSSGTNLGFNTEDENVVYAAEDSVVTYEARGNNAEESVNTSAYHYYLIVSFTWSIVEPAE